MISIYTILLQGSLHVSMKDETRKQIYVIHLSQITS
jgi:hypothetical protein